MQLEEYDLMYQVETYHWWYRGMEKISLAILDHWYRRGTDLRILDAGCGSGYAMVSYLKQYGEVTGVDISKHAINYTRQRGATRLVLASVADLPFQGASFGLVSSFDVLSIEAVGDDSAALGEFSRVLTKGGRIFLRLPAYDWLYSQHDRAIHTVRRYTTAGIARQLKANGFIVEYISYINTFRFPFALVKRLTEKIVTPKTHSSELAIRPGKFNAVFQNILEAEAMLIPKVKLPYGLTVIAVGRKI